MAEVREIVLTRLAHTHITDIYQITASESHSDAEELMDDFLDVVFDEAKHFPFQFPTCKGIVGSGDYRMAAIWGGYRVIFQIFKRKITILMVLHEDQLPV